ncbi:MAG: hypothetical protein PHI13_13310, partial [Methylococcales bacterium]|nr:hypothetical protein [Methylococcales bacterium]
MKSKKIKARRNSLWLKIIVLIFMALSMTILGVIALGGKEEISTLVLRLTELLKNYGAAGQA